MTDNEVKPSSEKSAAASPGERAADSMTEGASGAISLDELVSNTAGSPELAASLGIGDSGNEAKKQAIESTHSVAGAPVPGASLGEAANAASAEAKVIDPSQVMSQVDRVLTIEDPTFVESLHEIKDIGKDGDGHQVVLPEVHESGEIDDVPPHSWASVMLARKNGFKPLGIEFLGWFKFHLKNVIGRVLDVFKAILGAFMSLRLIAKVMVFGVVILSFALALVLKRGVLARSGSRFGLPVIEASFLGEFATQADRAFEYEDESQMVNFLDPMLHPENVVLVDHIVVNLKASRTHENPMALIDFYIEAGSKDAAIEVKLRDVEVRDSMSRVIEQISYEDIITDAGKYKLKVILRKTLNDFMTTGRVRRIYLKTFVLKP